MHGQTFSPNPHKWGKSCHAITLLPWLIFFFAALLWGSIIHKHTERWIWQGSASVVSSKRSNAPVVSNWFQPCWYCRSLCYFRQYLRLGTFVRNWHGSLLCVEVEVFPELPRWHTTSAEKRLHSNQPLHHYFFFMFRLSFSISVCIDCMTASFALRWS